MHGKHEQRQAIAVSSAIQQVKRACRMRLCGMMLIMMAVNGCGPRRNDAVAGIEPSVPNLQRLEFIAPRMGMQARIVLYADDAARGKAAADAAMTEIDRLDHLLSDYRDDSETAVVNSAAGAADPVGVSEAFIDVLQRSLEISRLSDGAFDVTVGPLTQLWRKARDSGRAPSQPEIDAAHALVNWRDVEITAVARTVRLKRFGMRLDFGGIGKGFAADCAMSVLQAHGVTRALVALAGDVRLGDPPPGARGWSIAINDGITSDAPTLELSDCGISTSGDVEQSLQIEGQRRSHIIDPRGGLGLPGRSAVTIIAPEATAADALATAVNVMGPEAGLAMIDGIERAAARFVIGASAGARIQSTARWPAKERVGSSDVMAPAGSCQTLPARRGECAWDRRRR